MQLARHFKVKISIHALREESDEVVPYDAVWYVISIHALREESDLFKIPALSSVLKFLSTPSARRATETGAMSVTPINISIHALREESDGLPSLHANSFTLFLSTPSARRATYFGIL